MTATDVLATTVTRLVDAIEAGGTGAWSMPWTRLGPDTLTPTNVATGNPYRSGNRWVLAMAAMTAGLDGGTWGTYRQWHTAGGQVRRGEHAAGAIVRPVERTRTDEDDDTGEETTYRSLTWRAVAVFHATQVDGWEPDTGPRHDHDPIDTAEHLVARWTDAGMVIIEAGDRACYRPLTDIVCVPKRHRFARIEHYYSTLAHEATHWTGPRLARDMTGRFASDAYAAEELVAELGAAIIGATVGIDAATRDDHAAYLAAWLRILRADPRHLFTVAAKAEAAPDHLLNLGATHPATGQPAVEPAA
jgi:antirestriction protein ArdC